MAKPKTSLSRWIADIVIALIPFLLIPWAVKEGPLDNLFRLLGGEENVGQGVIGAAIILVQTKYILQALAHRISTQSRDEMSGQTDQRLRSASHGNMLRKKWIDTFMVILTGFFVGALGGFGGALIGGLTGCLILLHAPR